MNAQTLLDMLKDRQKNFRYDAMVFLEISDRVTGASDTIQIGRVERLGDNIGITSTDYFSIDHPALTARDLMNHLDTLVPVCPDGQCLITPAKLFSDLKLRGFRIVNNAVMISCQVV